MFGSYLSIMLMIWLCFNIIFSSMSLAIKFASSDFNIEVLYEHGELLLLSSVWFSETIGLLIQLLLHDDNNISRNKKGFLGLGICLSFLFTVLNIFLYQQKMCPDEITINCIQEETFKWCSLSSYFIAVALGIICRLVIGGGTRQEH